MVTAASWTLGPANRAAICNDLLIALPGAGWRCALVLL